MFKKILVALDRTSEASAIFDFALSVAQSEESELLLVHFIDWQMQDVSPWIGIATLYDVDLSGDRYSWTRQRLEREIEISNEWLKSNAQRAREFGVNCQYECHVGNCNTGIGDQAKDCDADLIVMGRRGRSNISEMFLGSVSNYVIHHAPCSVLVVQGSKTSDVDHSVIAGEVSN